MRIATLVALGVLLLVAGAPQTATAQRLLQRLAEPLLDELEQRLTPPPMQPEPVTPIPQPQPGYLGLVADDQREGVRGVRILSVRAGGPADRAGLKPGDRITTINGQALRDVADMTHILRPLPAGRQLRIELMSNGRRQFVDVTLGQRPADGQPADRGDPSPQAPLPPIAGADPRAQLGVRAVPLTDLSRRNLRLPVRRGALIDWIQPGSPAARYGLPIGGVIVGVDRQPVDTPDDLVKLIARARPGQVVELSYHHRGRLYHKSVRLAPDVSAVASQDHNKPELELPSPPEAETPELAKNASAARNGEPSSHEKTGEIDTLRKRIVTLEDRVQRLQEQLNETNRLLAELRKSAETSNSNP